MHRNRGLAGTRSGNIVGGEMRTNHRILQRFGSCERFFESAVRHANKRALFPAPRNNASEARKRCCCCCEGRFFFFGNQFTGEQRSQRQRKRSLDPISEGMDGHGERDCSLLRAGTDLSAVVPVRNFTAPGFGRQHHPRNTGWWQQQQQQQQHALAAKGRHLWLRAPAAAHSRHPAHPRSTAARFQKEETPAKAKRRGIEGSQKSRRGAAVPCRRERRSRGGRRRPGQRRLCGNRGHDHRQATGPVALFAKKAILALWIHVSKKERAGNQARCQDSKTHGTTPEDRGSCGGSGRRISEQHTEF
mmetsp:Transcript_17396/g.39706  ORF Transcript_17396/g.39706 Transcript_17396/m.39706 type:complete len:303 (+) Transcript_17396:244-1152(+)